MEWSDFVAGTRAVRHNEGMGMDEVQPETPCNTE